MRVTQLINNKGNAVANHFIIIKGGSTYLQSYNSIVAKIDNFSNEVTLGIDWDYSATTLKHLKTFLEINDSKKWINEAIDNGVYNYENNQLTVE
jgi:hypothetical protein